MSNPVKVLRVIPTLESGGAENGLKAIVKALDPCRYEVTVCCLFRKGPLAEELEAAGVQVICLNAPQSGYGFSSVPRLIPVIREIRPDIVHTHLDAGNIAGILAARACRIPIIIANQHSANPYRGRFIRLIDHFLAYWTYKIVAVSKAAAQLHAKQSRISLDKYYIIHSVVSLAEFPFRSNRANGKPLGLDGQPLIGNVGRLTLPKGQIYLLRAFPKVLAESPDAQLLFVGDGPLLEQLIEAAQNLGINDRVILAGRRRDILQILRCLDLFVLPSLWEGCGTAPLEAMAVGVPIVASAVGGVPEMIIDGKTGSLVPPADPDSLANVMISLLRNRFLAEKYALEARRYVEESFSEKVAASRTDQLYQEALAAKRLRQ